MRTARCAERPGPRGSATTTSLKAFEFAHEADPDAELYYNDYNLWKPAKREGAIRIVNELRSRGLRVDAVGEQAHWGIAEPSLEQIDETLGDIPARTGVKVMLTELDIDVLPRDPAMWGADLSAKATIRAATNIYPDRLPDEQQQAARTTLRQHFRTRPASTAAGSRGSRSGA